MIEQVADAVRRLLDRGTANSSVSVLARHPG